MPPTAPLECGRSYRVIVRFDYDAPDGVRWDIAAGSLVTIMERRPKDVLRIRVGALTFNVGGEWLAARVAATEGK